MLSRCYNYTRNTKLDRRVDKDKHANNVQENKWFKICAFILPYERKCIRGTFRVTK